MRIRRQVVQGWDADDKRVWLVLEQITIPSRAKPGFDFRQEIYSEADLQRWIARDKELYDITISTWTYLLEMIEQARATYAYQT